MRLAATALLAITAGMGGCADPEYDASSPQAALDSMREMIADDRASRLTTLVHIDARDIKYDDGVTEASAINDVLAKTGDMLQRLIRVARHLRARFPVDVQQALAQVDSANQRPDAGLTRFMIDPLGLLDEQRSRLTVEDLGDGTAALLIDGKPVLGFGLQMRDIDGTWKVDVPIDLLRDYRPNTREEWSVLASMMLSMENALMAFEDELAGGKFRDLNHASRRAGRLLGERVVVQAIIYSNMKKHAPKDGKRT
jgi:hypothetical protein